MASKIQEPNWLNAIRKIVERGTDGPVEIESGKLLPMHLEHKYVDGQCRPHHTTRITVSTADVMLKLWGGLSPDGQEVLCTHDVLSAAYVCLRVFKDEADMV